jgi:ElaB/YqjD/DUF883 family membrane-anchored ribosome-binding protein
METDNPKVSQDIETVKGDVRRVRDDLAGIIRSAKSRSKDSVMEMSDRIKDVMSDFRGKAEDKLREKSEAIKDRGHETIENWRGSIEDRPVTSLLIAFATGFVFAFIIARRRD